MAEKLQQAMLNASSFFDTGKILENKITVKISFWGIRKICVEGYEGTFTFKAMREKLFALVAASKSRNVTPDEVEEAKVTWAKSRKIGHLMEKQESKVCCITKIFLFMFHSSPTSVHNGNYWYAVAALNDRFGIYGGFDWDTSSSSG